MNREEDNRPTHADLTMWRVFTFIFIVVSIALSAGMWSMSTRVDPADLVFDVCNQSRISSTIKESGCGELQDQLRMEFLCEQNNTDPATICRVERKQQ